MKAHFAIAVSLLAAALTFGCQKTEKADGQKLRLFLLSKTMADALVARTQITEIREGRTSNAIEYLEFSIDCAIDEMGNSTNYDAATQQQILQTLRSLKEYRQKYPRKIEAVVGDDDELKESHEMTEKANEVLEHVR